jgi:integrase
MLQMRYLNKRKTGGYRYLRAYPSSFKTTFPSLPSQYSRELPELSDNSDDADVHRAMQEASRAYDLHIKMLNASDPASFTDSERTLAVEEILRRRKLKAGEFHGHEDGSAWAEGAFPEIGYEIRPDSDIDRARTFQEEVTIDAFFASQKLPEVKRRKTFRQAWRDYLKAKRLDTRIGDGKAKQQRFERVIAITGDFTIADETKDDVLDRLQQFISYKQDNGSKAQSIKRELKEVIAAIRTVPRLAWSDAVTLDKKKNSLFIHDEERPNKARVLTNTELNALIEQCLSNPDEKWCSLLIQLHAGIGPREISRLRIDKDVFLESKYPHILFRGGDEGIAKKQARIRVVPIVLGLDTIKKWLPTTIAWTQSLDQDSPVNTLNKRLRSLLNGKDDKRLKTHGLRHTWLRLAKRAEISDRHIHAIAGWSQNVAEASLMSEVVYDPNGFVEDIELLAKLYRDQTKVFEPLHATSIS